MKGISTFKVIKNDYLAFLMAIGGPVLFLITLVGGVFGFIPRARFIGFQDVDPGEIRILFVISFVLTLVLFTLLVRRIGRIERIVLRGPKVTAHIVSVKFMKDRGRVEYEYEHDGQVYRSGTAIMKSKATMEFQEGQDIEVAVDPDNPRKTVLVSLFTA